MKKALKPARKRKIRKPVGRRGKTQATPADLAQSLKETGKVIFLDLHASGVNDGATALKNINDTEAGLEAKRSSYGSAPGGSVMLNESMLEGNAVVDR